MNLATDGRKIGMKNLIAVVFLGVSVVGYSASAPEILFRGKDSRSGVICELKVNNTFYKGNSGQWADFQAEVSTSYSHDGESAGSVTLSSLKSDETLLGGPLQAGKDIVDPKVTSIQVRLATKKDLNSATVFRLRWLHGSHFHTFDCKGLKAVTVP